MTASQRRIVLSRLRAGEAAAVWAPGHASYVIGVPLEFLELAPVAASQSRTVSSSLALARVRPSGLQATLDTPCSVPEFLDAGTGGGVP